MQTSLKGLFVALLMIAGGVVAFFVILALAGVDPDEQPLGVFGWMLFGVLVGPGFGYLIRWRHKYKR